MRRTLAGLSASLLVVGCLAGCGGGADKLPLVSVKGKLTVDGKAPGKLTLQLTPEDAMATTPPTPLINASVNEQGEFSCTTYEPGDGIPAGKYRVGMTMDAMSPGTPIPVVKPTIVVVTEGMSELLVELEGTGKAFSGMGQPGNEGGFKGDGKKKK